MSGHALGQKVENTVWHDEGFAIDNSFRIEIREFYGHDAGWAQPGGAGYAISLANGSSDVLPDHRSICRPRHRPATVFEELPPAPKPNAAHQSCGA